MKAPRPQWQARRALRRMRGTPPARRRPVGDRAPLPRQDEAIALVWKYFGQVRRAPPPIFWRTDRLVAGQRAHAFRSDGADVLGICDSAGWIELGAPSIGARFSDTALAHELLHAVLWDREHKSPLWGQFLDGANAMLKAEGL